MVSHIDNDTVYPLLCVCCVVYPRIPRSQFAQQCIYTGAYWCVVVRPTSPLQITTNKQTPEGCITNTLVDEPLTGGKEGTEEVLRVTPNSG